MEVNHVYLRSARGIITVFEAIASVVGGIMATKEFLASAHWMDYCLVLSFVFWATFALALISLLMNSIDMTGYQILLDNNLMFGPKIEWVYATGALKMEYVYVTGALVIYLILSVISTYYTMQSKCNFVYWNPANAVVGVEAIFFLFHLYFLEITCNNYFSLLP